jgi:hypothetical protein
VSSVGGACRQPVARQQNDRAKTQDLLSGLLLLLILKIATSCL